MEKVTTDKFRFKPGFNRKYRRLSVRECALIQTFPLKYKFEYERITDGYKMIGNAVPVEFAYHLAIAVKQALAGAGGRRGTTRKPMNKAPDFSRVEVKDESRLGKTRRVKARNVVG
jgi:DNA (cytosine-5)-methyltransferase 1